MATPDVTATYDDRVDEVVVATASVDLPLSVSAAKGLIHQLAVAVMNGELARGITSGEGVWVTPNWFVPADAAAAMWAQRKTGRA
jgi:hypothetical protein